MKTIEEIRNKIQRFQCPDKTTLELLDILEELLQRSSALENCVTTSADRLAVVEAKLALEESRTERLNTRLENFPIR